MENKPSAANEIIAAAQYVKERDFWLETLAGDLVKSTFPYDGSFAASPHQAHEPSQEEFDFDVSGKLYDKLMKLCGERDNRLHMILIAAMALLLEKYTFPSAEDGQVTLGTPIYKQETHGDFINTVLPLRFNLTPGMSFKDMMLSARTTITAAADHQNYPMNLLPEKLNIPLIPGEFPLFDVAVVLENIQDIDYLSGLSHSLTLIASRRDRQLNFSLRYNSARYHAQTIQRIAGHFTLLLNSVAFAINTPVSEFSLLTDEEKQTTLQTFNDVKQKFPKEKTIHRLFEEMVRLHPHKTALVQEDQVMTYDLLNQRANRLAHELRRRGVTANSIVSLKADPSFDMMIAILAILKAGGAYLPLNSQYPEERIKYMFKDTGSRLLITQEKYSTEMTYAKDILLLEDLESLTGADDTDNLELADSSQNLCYVIYTSGTTGKPKGNLTMHYNVVRVVKSTNYIDIFPEDRVLQLSSYAFDGSVFDIYGALLNGSALVLLDRDGVVDVSKLSPMIRGKEVTVFFVTTALFNILVDYDIDALKYTRKILFGGERVSVEHSRSAVEHLGEGRIIHVYGPTESTVYASWYFIDDVPQQINTIPIGKPLANTTLYVLGNHLQPQPIGIVGELCVGGDGLARGYLNRPELTAEKFIPHPFASVEIQSCEKIYKTGDLARWLPGGDIEFVGRIDHQVKIRGFRIELGEIESRLLKLPMVNEALVIDRDSPQLGKYLCAYLVMESELDTLVLKEVLLRHLPEYMVPAYYVRLDAIPLNANKKVDRAALPEPQFQARESYVAPRNDIEKTLVNIWAELLAIEEDVIGIDTDFFEMGGHSLKATIMISRIQKQLGVKVPLAEIFRIPTIRDLAQLVKESNVEEFKPIEPVPPRDRYLLSPGQKRLYTLQQLDTNLVNYNLPVALQMDGALDYQRLKETFQKLVDRHESFRTRFVLKDGEVYQEILPELKFNPQELGHLQEGPEAVSSVKTMIRRFVRAFDLSQPSLLRVAILFFDNNPMKHVLLVDMHHIISDGTTMGIFIKEFVNLYQGKILAPPRVQYKDYSQWQNDRLQSGLIKKQEAYWLTCYQGELPVLKLPTDHPRPAVQSFEGGWISFVMEEEETDAIKKLAKETDSTLFMMILSFYTILLSRLSPQGDIVVGTTIAGRRHADVQDMMGMFVNMLPLRNTPDPEKTFLSFLKDIRRNTLEAFENQDYQFEDLVEKLNIPRDVSRHPLFDVCISLGNMDVPDIELPGLTVKPIEKQSDISKFDLTLSVFEAKSTLLGSLEFCNKLFEHATAQRFVDYFNEIVAAVLENPEIKLQDIKISVDLYSGALVEPEDDDDDFGF